MLEKTEKTKLEIAEISDYLGEENTPDRVTELKSQIALQKALLTNDTNEIRSLIGSVPIRKKLSPGELDLVSEFVMTRGSATNKELAYKLNITEDACKNRFKQVFQKMNISSRAELFSFVLQK